MTFDTNTDLATDGSVGITWNGIPHRGDGPWVLWPNNDVASFLAFWQQLPSVVLYRDEAHSLLCIAYQGVLHFYEATQGTLRSVQPLNSDWEDDEGEDIDELTGHPRIEVPAELRALADSFLQEHNVPSGGLWWRGSDTLATEFYKLVPNFDRDASMAALHEAGMAISSEASRICAQLIVLPEFDPLTYQVGVDTGDDFVSLQLPDAPQGLLVEVRMQLRNGATQRGLYAVARHKLSVDASNVIAAMPAPDRDLIAFSRTSGARLARLAPFLREYHHYRHPGLANEVAQQMSGTRDAVYTRYARACHLLRKRGLRNGEIAERLSISPSTVSRFISQYSPGTLDEGDYLIEMTVL